MGWVPWRGGEVPPPPSKASLGKGGGGQRIGAARCTSRELGTSLASNCCVQLLNVRVSEVEENKSTQATFVLRVAD